MNFVVKGVTTALLMAVSLTSASALAWEKDKTYNITICLLYTSPSPRD